jgi:hypothetical protein
MRQLLCVGVGAATARPAGPHGHEADPQLVGPAAPQADVRRTFASADPVVRSPLRAITTEALKLRLPQVRACG